MYEYNQVNCLTIAEFIHIIFNKEILQMKCFMHRQKDAIGVCKTCGKAMCSDCSSYSGHSSICPVCLKNQMEKELNLRTIARSSLRSKMITCFVFAVIILIVSVIIAISAKFPVILIIAAVIDVILIIAGLKKLPVIKNIESRIKYLQGEIYKINSSLLQGSGQI